MSKIEFGLRMYGVVKIQIIVTNIFNHNFVGFVDYSWYSLDNNILLQSDTYGCISWVVVESKMQDVWVQIEQILACLIADVWAMLGESKHAMYY